MLPSAQMKRVAQDLRGALSSMQVKDVRCWHYDEETMIFALVGDPLRLERTFLTGLIPNRRNHLDVTLQRALGLPGEVTQRGYPRHQFMPDGEVHHSEMLQGLEGMIDALLDQDESTVVTLMPESGTPWSPQNDPTPYYTAKRNRVVQQTRPAWVVEVEMDMTRHGRPGGEVTVLGADFCQLSPVIACSAGTVVGAFDSPRAPNFLVTHSFEVGGRIDRQAAESVRQCGGLLFPSLAVGQIPAYNFGNVALVGYLDLVLRTLRPYKRRGGAWPVTVYETDTWTVTTTQVLREGSRELFEELTGAPSVDWIYKDDFWVLGPPISTRGDTEPIRTTKKLRAALSKRDRIYDPDMDHRQLEDTRARHRDTAEAYPYLEAKANGIVPLDCFPYAIVPEAQAAEAADWLELAGFSGRVIELPADLPADYVPPSDDERDARWDFGWEASEALFTHAEEQGLVLDVDV